MSTDILTGWKSKVLEKTMVATDTILLKISKPANFNFLAGQFIQFLIPLNGKLVARSYSITSTPNDEALSFYIYLLKDGIASNHLRAIQLGDSLDCRGPFGKFVLAKDYTKIYFICTGVGIAPAYSILCQEIMQMNSNINISLIFGLRNEENIFLKDELENLRKKYDNFSYKLSLSRANDDWSGLTGRVTAHLNEIDTNAHFFICGNPEMVRDTEKLLLGRSVLSANIHREIY